MNDTQLLRYSRHILLPDIGITGQQKLLDSKVLIIGLGGLGSPVAMYLASSGVGHLDICDDDTVDISNLQRQIIHQSDKLGQTKVSSAREQLLALNPDIQITGFEQRLTEAQLRVAVAEADVVVDCTDNLAVRLQINRAAVMTRTPLVMGAAIRMEGQVSVFTNNSPETPCYHCIYGQAQEIQETCTQSGVLSPLVGVIGSMQALETLKLLLNLGENLGGKLLLFDALAMEWQTIKLKKHPQCAVCSGT
jgi:molybdopterin-synthase adenylyltransferase